MSIAIFLVTGSPFALLFAGLGPLTALGSLVDGRFVRRRRSRAELARFEAELVSVRREIRDAHDAERRDLEQASPPAFRLATGRGREAVRWSAADPTGPRVRLGRGDVASRVALDGSGGLRGDDESARRLRALRAEAETVADTTVTVEATEGIGIIGPAVVAEALARAIALQLAAMVSPARWTVISGHNSWLRNGPHRSADGASSVVVFRPLDTSQRSDGDIVVAVAAAERDLPAHLGTVIAVRGTRALVVRATEQLPLSFVPELLTGELAGAWAEAVAALAVADGLATAVGAIPDAVEFAELPQEPVDPLRPELGGLRCAIGLGSGGAEFIDLVRDGPHAIVGGTTGSGKSELLVSWLLAMARRYPPSAVAFLLFDFKGGSSFGEITGLPHSVGLLTDLDAEGAERAIASLGAELRHRERLVAKGQVRSIEELPTSTGPGRLVVVVDEFAALASDLPALNAQFGDIAARGRSLGIHLVLCTQRPVGVIRDAVLANTALRISLRVNNRPDSTAVIGTDDAATTGTPPGRAWISRDSAAPVAVQVAQARAVDVAAVASSWSGHALPRRPWLDPLAARLDPATLPAGAFGLLDLPSQQRQDAAYWNPEEHGNVLVIGAGRSGKSTALAAMAPGAIMVPTDVEGAWDVLVALVQDTTPRLVVIDDLDALLTSFGPEYERSVIELVVLLLRGTGRARHHLVLAAQRLSAPLQQLAALCDSRLLLRQSTRQEHLLAGGSAETFIADLGRGAGHWRGVRVQVAAVDGPRQHSRQSEDCLDPTGLVIAVSSRPAALAERFSRAGVRSVELGAPAEGSALRHAETESPLVLVASAEGWQAHWNALTAMRARFPLLIEGGSLAEFRSMSRLRQLPPPISDESRSAWLVQPSGAVQRVLLP